MEQMAKPEQTTKKGQSYTSAVILTARNANLLSVEYCYKFAKNDPATKRGYIDQLMRQYSVNLCIGDIGFSQDFSTDLHIAYGDKYLVSRAHPKVNGHIKYDDHSIPKEITFEKNYYYTELIEKLKRGEIKFPLGDYEKSVWLMQHCCSMDYKPVLSQAGEHQMRYIKGSTPNDGFCALLNAYIAFKFLISKGFSINNPLLMNDFTIKQKPLVLAAYLPKR